MWHNNKDVTRVYTTHDSQNAWAAIQGLGWKKIKRDDADGVTNVFMVMCAARANGKTVSVHLDDDEIDIAYLN